ncbi:DUF1580 domain-containing protein [Singulisphaera sp. PoT]|uniref:DUF1580 domain-containing protein n=1 Tax=Singulisphaera sp. PoT TaxID=3411797 RepID=UPI003BF4D78C
MSTIYRWSTSGCRGVVLETIQIGGSRWSSREALQRFFEELTAARTRAKSPGAQAQQGRSTSQRLKALAVADRELDAMGVSV